MIAEIENAMIACIQAAATATPGLGYAIPTVASYGGEMDELTPELIRVLPAVWVVYAGGPEPKPMNSQKTKWLTAANFALIVAARNVRGERATRQGLTVGGQIKEVGSYQLLRDVSLMLLGNDLALNVNGEGIKPFRPGRTRTLYNTQVGGQAISVFSREFRTAYIETAPRQNFDPASGDFLSIGMSYYLNQVIEPPAEQGSITL